MRILVLSNKIPYPSIDGGSIATLNLSLSLADQGNSVTLLAMNTEKHYFPVENIPSEISNKIKLIAVDVPAKISVSGALKNMLFSKNPYTAERFLTANFRKALADLLIREAFDIIQLEGLYVGLYVPLIRSLSKAKIVYRAHNLEFEIWERAAIRSQGLKKWYLNKLAIRLLKFEKELVQEYDAILPISDKDGQWFLEQVPKIKIHTVPAGIIKDFKKSTSLKKAEPDLFHIGALDWLPNQEGLLWFFNKAWPAIHQKYPNLKFYLAGRNASEEMKALKAPNLIFVGEVESASDFMHSHSIMIVPLFSGSGMRIKIIEAMAERKAVISTTLGLEGNPARDKQEVLIANDELEFLSRIDDLLAEPEKISELGEAAGKFVDIHFSQGEIAKQTQAFYTLLLQ